MPGGAKDFFFSAAPVQTATEADETPEPAAVNQVNDTEAPEQNFFNPGTTETDAETEPPPAAFFKPEVKTTGETEAPSAAAFFANSAPSSTTSGAGTRPSFFNPGGAIGGLFGGSDNNEAQADSELERDSEQEFESNND